MAFNQKKLAGLLFFVGGVQLILAIIIGEARYPDYNIAHNYISDLGVNPASALIFNGSSLLLGLLTIAAAYNIHRAFNSRLFTMVIAFAGIGAAGVGIFHENLIRIHSVFALLAFGFSGISAIVSSRFVKNPYAYIGAALGALSLLALVLLGIGIDLGIGNGGMERLVAYPTLLWIVGFGGYLMSDQNAAPATSKL